MVKQEQAINILKQFNDAELDRFIAYFSIIYPVRSDENEMQKRRDAFERMKQVSRYIPGLDDKKELAEYREEKYGK